MTARPPRSARAARICWIATLLYWCGLFGVTHIPAPKLPHIPVTDKTAHSFSYAVLALGLFSALYLGGTRAPGDVAVIVLATLLLYGVFDEQTQKLVNRSCEMADWNADAAGTGVAVVSAYAIARWREKRKA